MSKYELSSERLDTEFDHFLLDMKPYVLKHPSKTERQRCAQWIKKLCDPATCGSGLIGRKNRNMYARLLLQMLKRGVLDGPFTSKPEPGSLKTLPTYMSIYFDEPMSSLSVEHGVRSLPDWVTGELSGCSDDSLTMDLLKDKPSSTPVKDHHRRRPYEDRAASRPVSSSPLRQSPRQVTRMVDGEPNHMSPDDSDLEARLNSWNLGIEKPRYLREEPVPLSPIFKSSFGGKSNLASDQGAQLLQSKETEMKIKVLEAKHQEEKLKMQQRHDAEVEKILDRKNGEIEEMKSLHRTRQKESEETIRKLEKKVQSVLRESQVICESKEKQIAELKKMSDQSADSLKNEWEKKLHAAVTKMEQEKFELQKKHTQNIQELLEDTNVRLAKMESDYNARSQATEQTMRELELRVKQQSAEVEKGNTLRQKVTQEKAELEIHIASISTELQEANRRIMILQKEKEELSEQHEQATQKLQVKYETDLSHLHHEHALSAAKASEVMADLEKTVAQIKQQLEDSEHRRHQQVRDQEMKFQQEKDELLISCEKKVLALQTEAEKEKAEAKRKIAKLEEALREKESQLDRARESQRQHIQQADMALEQFKKQVELSSEKAYADMKLQMAEQRMQHEQERTRLQQQHSAEKDSLVQEHQREASSLERQARAALQQHQQHTQEWRKRDAQTIADLEAQLSELREDLKKAHAQHKQQLAEMALLQEEEKQRATQDKRATLDRLERNHQQEKDAALEKTNSRLKQIEREYSQKLAKSAQLIAELQTSVCDSKEEAIRLQTAMEKQLKEANARWEEERKTVTHRADQTHKALQEKVESLQRQLHLAEKNLLSKELETEEKVTMVHKEYEEKIKGLMPVELRQELEDTISSLKAQVNFLQMRASLLQEDLDACRSSRCRREPCL
ncbi:centrosomal protein of 112 kDa isoform X3 [Neolamprologus brichardi]|uniref:centrosomal protein of 112 kDa isoform X3 n=1 Tax=Neolamprologus brichardi TaxID=32507 RepID=UPI0003EBC0CE|nr:centrosomal protein of 112 kDa isoform X3 [Neolamprologus brichardi]